MAALRPLGWGFIGAGGVARRRMLPAVAGHPAVRVSAVMVRDQVRARAIAAEFGAAAAYDRVEALLDDPAVEAVYLATPPDVHEEQVLAAAARGKHVLLEKPMALTSDACERMVAAAAAAGIQLAVCFPLRHTPAMRLLHDWLTTGRLGELIYLRAQLAKWYPLAADDWRADPARSGGGVVMDLGSHLLDLATWLGGPVTAVEAVVARRVWPVPVEDSAVLTTTFSTGAWGILESSFAVFRSENRVELYGTEGLAWVGGPRDGGAVHLTTAAGEEEQTPPPANVYAGELLDFQGALQTGRPPATRGLDGWANVCGLEAAYRAARDGRRQDLVAPGGGADPSAQ